MSELNNIALNLGAGGFNEKFFEDFEKMCLQIKKWEDLNFLEAIIIGFFQVLAFIPGASRAGVTITGARILNIKRESAAVFSM